MCKNNYTASSQEGKQKLHCCIYDVVKNNLENNESFSGLGILNQFIVNGMNWVAFFTWS